ncbi:MAG: FixH family protein [Bacteroidia bacterium]
MNISWGYRIAALYIGFVILVLFMVFLAMNQKIELVTPDYYAKELKFQQEIDALNNAGMLSANVQVEIQNNAVIIAFPEEMKNLEIKGEALMFRPSDSSLDISFPLELNTDGKMLLKSEKFKTGLYKLIVKWTTEGKNYQSEHTVVLP